MPMNSKTVAAVWLSFVALDVTTLAGDASCAYLLGARTMGLLWYGLSRHTLLLIMNDALRLPGASLG